MTDRLAAYWSSLDVPVFSFEGVLPNFVLPIILVD